MAGRMGHERVTILNLEVVRVDAERNLILVKGAVPGPDGGLVIVRSSVRNPSPMPERPAEPEPEPVVDGRRRRAETPRRPRPKHRLNPRPEAPAAPEAEAAAPTAPRPPTLPAEPEPADEPTGRDVSGGIRSERQDPRRRPARPRPTSSSTTRSSRAKVSVPLMHQIVIAQLAAARAGTHSTKTRGEVRGGGAKPWRQKGTGRARHGSSREPQWKGGGIAFGPKPRDHSQSRAEEDEGCGAAFRAFRPRERRQGVRRRRALVRDAEDQGSDRRAQGVGHRGQGAARAHARGPDDARTPSATCRRCT